jgi:outer membrane protein assembly factor BamB
VRLFPADVTAKPGEKIQFKVVYVDANGREVEDNRPSPLPKWSLPLPPKTPAGAQPPALQGTLEGGVLTLAAVPSQQGYVDFEDVAYTARARVRVAPGTSYKQDFERLPEGAAPGGWVNVAGKFFAKKMGDSMVLAKVNTDARPPIAKANAYITGPDASDYTIQVDVMGTLVRGRMADLGIVNSRYTFLLVAAPDPVTSKRDARVQSWDGKRRIDVGHEFDWKPDTWYTLKLTVEQKEKTAHVRAKVWKRGEQEPEKWTIDFEDVNPNRSGAAALFGNVTNVSQKFDGSTDAGAEIYYDNLIITPNGKK